MKKDGNFDLHAGVRFITKDSSTGWIHDGGYGARTKERALKAMGAPFIGHLGMNNPVNVKLREWVLATSTDGTIV